MNVVRRKEKRRREEERCESEGQEEKNNAKYPDSRTPTLLLRSPLPFAPFLFFLFFHSRPFIRRPQYRQERHPLATGGPSRLLHCATFAQGLLEIRASDFFPFFRNATTSPSLPLRPRDRAGNQRSCKQRRKSRYSCGNVRMTTDAAE